jgi:YVTN family beta-propeller protein
MFSVKKTGAILWTALALALAARGESYLSPCDLDWSVDGQDLYVTAATGQKVLQFDAASRRVTREIPLPCVLTGTAVTSDGKTLYVTGGGHRGSVFDVDLGSGKVRRRLDLGHTPTAPVLAPDGKTLFVCNQFNNNVSIIDLATWKEQERVPVLREPSAADITPDGKTLFVANLIPDGAANVDYVASKISAIDVASRNVTTIKLVNGAEGMRGLRVSPDGKHVYATHLMARFFVPTTQLERGWVSTDALSVIRASDMQLLYTVLLDDVDMGFPNPWAISFSDDGQVLLVSAAGSHEISVIDLPKLTEKVTAEAGSKSGEAHLDAHNDLSFLSGIRRRLRLNGNGPRAMAVKGTTAYVANYFSDAIDCVDFVNPDTVPIQTVELNPGMQISEVRQGEMHFNDANLCFQKWLSCATCHPDARTDALNWDLLNDGIGNPKNVKSMVLSHQTPRAMWLGVRADAPTGVRAGLRYIQFAVRPEEDALAIDAYLSSLVPEPSPYLVEGKLSQSAERGKVVFETIGCMECHPTPLFTDLKMYDVGTTTGQDAGRPVDVPTLREGWRNAPYLHDGRAATLRELFTVYGHAGFKEKLSKVAKQELDDLIEYVNSL